MLWGWLNNFIFNGTIVYITIPLWLGLYCCYCLSPIFMEHQTRDQGKSPLNNSLLYFDTIIFMLKCLYEKQLFTILFSAPVSNVNLIRNNETYVWFEFFFVIQLHSIIMKIVKREMKYVHPDTQLQTVTGYQMLIIT